MSKNKIEGHSALDLNDQEYQELTNWFIDKVTAVLTSLYPPINAKLIKSRNLEKGVFFIGSESSEARIIISSYLETILPERTEVIPSIDTATRLSGRVVNYEVFINALREKRSKELEGHSAEASLTPQENTQTSVQVRQDPQIAEVASPQRDKPMAKIVILSDFDGTATGLAGESLVFTSFYQSFLKGYKEGVKSTGYQKGLRLDYKGKMVDVEERQKLFEEEFGKYPNITYKDENKGILMSPETVQTYHEILANPDTKLYFVTKNQKDYIESMFRFQGFSEEEISRLVIVDSVELKSEKTKQILNAEQGVQSIYVLDDNQLEYQQMEGAAKSFAKQKNNPNIKIHGHHVPPGKFAWPTYYDTMQKELSPTTRSKEKQDADTHKDPDSPQSLFEQSRGIPLVGLINKETGQIVLGRCVPEKVELQLDKDGKVISGHFIDSNRKCNDKDLEKINKLMQEGYLPRQVTDQHGNIKTSHEFLFEHSDIDIDDKSKWGGFAVTWEKSEDELNFTFASGAFNSPHVGRRIKGAQLDITLQDQVKSQITSWKSLLSKPTSIKEPAVTPSTPMSNDSFKKKKTTPPATEVQSPLKASTAKHTQVGTETSKPIIWSIKTTSKTFGTTLETMKQGEWLIRETSYVGVLSVVKKGPNGTFKQTCFMLAPELDSDKVQKKDANGKGLWVWTETPANKLKHYTEAVYEDGMTEIHDGGVTLTIEELAALKSELGKNEGFGPTTVRHTGVMFQLAGQSATDSLFKALQEKGYTGEPRPADDENFQAIGCRTAVTANRYKSYLAANPRPTPAREQHWVYPGPTSESPKVPDVLLPSPPDTRKFVKPDGTKVEHVTMRFQDPWSMPASQKAPSVPQLSPPEEKIKKFIQEMLGGRSNAVFHFEEGFKLESSKELLKNPNIPIVVSNSSDHPDYFAIQLRDLHGETSKYLINKTPSEVKDTPRYMLYRVNSSNEIEPYASLDKLHFKQDVHNVLGATVTRVCYPGPSNTNSTHSFKDSITRNRSNAVITDPQAKEGTKDDSTGSKTL